MDELKILRNSYLEGLISEKEYNAKKTELIDQLTRTTLKKEKKSNEEKKDSSTERTVISKQSFCLSTLSEKTTDDESAIDSPKSIQTTNARRSSTKILKRYKERQSTDLGLDSQQLREMREKSTKKPLLGSDSSENSKLSIPQPTRSAVSGDFSEVVPKEGKLNTGDETQLDDIFEIKNNNIRTDQVIKQTKMLRKNQSLVDFFVETRKRGSSADSGPMPIVLSKTDENPKRSQMTEVVEVIPDPKVTSSKDKTHPQIIEKLLSLEVKDLNTDDKLCYYTAAGELDQIKELFKNYADSISINMIHQKFSRFSVLHIATIANHVQIVEYLLDQGAAPDVTDALLRTSLHISCNQGFREIGIVLLGKGASVNLRDLYGITPIHLVMKGNYFDFANDLLLFGADINMKNTNGKTVLHDCMEDGNVEGLKYLISLPKFSKLLYNIKDLRGETPLHRGITKNNVEVVRLLLPHADVLCTSDSGKNVFHMAVINNSIEALLELESSIKLTQSDVINKPDKSRNKWYAIHYAVKQKSLDLTKALVRLGCDLNVQDADGNTPFHLAVQSDLIDISKYLSEQRAKKDIKNNKGETVKTIMKRTKIVL